MRLEHLKELMLLPEKEYLINKGVSIRGIDVHILSLTIEEDKNRLWLIYEQEDSFEDELDSDMENENTYRTKTNREEKLENIERDNTNKSFFIEEMIIQNQIITLSSSSSITIYDMNIEGIMNLQYFVEKGLIPNKWDNIRLKNLVISQYEQSRNEKAPVIDDTKELDIKLNIGPDSREILIQHPFKVKFGKQNEKIIYFDEKLNREDYFFINEIYSFDVYQYIEKSVEKIENLEMRKDVLNNLMEAAERVYPKDKNLAVIKYEIKNNIQLNFYMKDFLDADQIDCRNTEPYIHDDSTIGAATSIGFIWGSSEEDTGINGYKLRECILQPISKDFNGELEIELFSRNLQIPGRMVEC